MRICSGPGCLRAVCDGVRFCPECQPIAPIVDITEDIREHGNKYDADIDRIKTGKRWQDVRRRCIVRDPLCRRCELSISEIADHVVPAQIAIAQARASGKYPFDRFAGFYFLSNLQGLCRSCHWHKTQEDKAHTGEWPDVVAKQLLTPKKKYTF